MRYFKVISLIALLMTAVVGCSNDDNGTGPDQPDNTASTTWDGVAKFWVTKLDASATQSTNYTYYSFETRDVVTLTDEQAETSDTWDLAFKKSYIKTNGGFSGPGDAKGVNLVTASIVDEDEFAEVGATELAAVQSSQWMEDGYDFALDSLWNYNPITHQLSTKKYVYILSDAAGNMVKFQLLDVIGGSQPPAQGAMVIKYFYQPAVGATNVSGEAEVDTIDAPNGFYFDFSSGQVVTPANPATSTDWDIRIYSYDVYLNGSIFGTGQGAAFPVYDGLVDRTDFDAVANINQFGPPRWVLDEMQSAFTITDWYNYNFQTHQLSSKKNTYIVQVGGKSYKVFIVSYYNTDTQASGHYTINWAEL